MLLFLFTVDCCACLSLSRRTGGSSTRGDGSFSSPSSENRRRLHLSARAASVLALFFSFFRCPWQIKRLFSRRWKFVTFPTVSGRSKHQGKQDTSEGSTEKTCEFGLIIFATFSHAKLRSRLVSRLSHGKLKSAVRNGHFPNNSRTELSTGCRFPLFGKTQNFKSHFTSWRDREKNIFAADLAAMFVFIFKKPRHVAWYRWPPRKTVFSHLKVQWLEQPTGAWKVMGLIFIASCYCLRICLYSHAF